MTDDELGRLLSEAFDAQARGAVGDHGALPPPRFANPATAELSTITTTRPARRRPWAPLAAAAAVVAVAAGISAVVITDDGGRSVSSAVRPTTTAAPSSTVQTSGSAAQPAATTVHITTLNSDGVTYVVGMPVIAYFSRAITDARAFQAATKVTANGKPLTAAWYFQPSSAGQGPIEGHLRPQQYWPAHSRIRVQFPAAGTALGDGLRSDGKLASLDFRTGARTIITVDDRSHTLTLTSDGKDLGKFPVSLGAANTPTMRGTKVIMEKGRSISMKGPGYNVSGVRYTQRLTYGGEYLHAAPWNVRNIDQKRDTSNGCTNLLTADAKQLYDQTLVGDVVLYPNADGPTMQVGEGYGDWNLSWAAWRTGGLVPTE